MRKKIRKKSKRSYSRRKKKTSKLRQTTSNVFKLLILIAVVGFIIYSLFLKPTTKKEVPATLTKKETKKVNISSLPKPEAVDQTLRELFKKYELLDSWITQRENQYKVRLPVEVQAIVLIHDVFQEMEKLDCEIVDSREDLNAHQSILEIGYKDNIIKKVILVSDPNLKRFQGKIAIIIDDFGYSESEEIKTVLQSPYPITIAIIPGLPKSNELYQLAQQHNKETIIHMPMEAIDDKVEYTNYTLYASNMTDDDISQRVRTAIADFPLSRGMNNHMGSKVTSDKRIMRLVMQELKRGEKYFIDSKTTNQSVAYEMAKAINVPSNERDIFLDNDPSDTEDYLKKKIIALTKIVQKTGKAVAIGHPYKNTVNVLMEEIPKLEKEGFVFVPASEIVK